MSETILEEVTLELIKTGVIHRIPNIGRLALDSMEMDQTLDYMRNSVILCFTNLLAGEHIETHKCPINWWNALKERVYKIHFRTPIFRFYIRVPSFIKRKFPVKRNEIKLHNICPHIDIPWKKNQDIHLCWANKNHGFIVSPKGRGEEAK